MDPASQGHAATDRGVFIDRLARLPTTGRLEASQVRWIERSATDLTGYLGEPLARTEFAAEQAACTTNGSLARARVIPRLDVEPMSPVRVSLVERRDHGCGRRYRQAQGEDLATRR